MAPGLRAEDFALRDDPAILRGTLPNGLAYAVLKNANPRNGLSIRFAFRVGSLDESDEERGAAHFIEHLAFDGRSPEWAAATEAAFAAAGVSYGADRNAHTTLSETSYEVDLPKADRRTVDLALGWLREIADGGRFSEAVVNRERGVILAERESDLGAAERVVRALAAFEGEGLRFPGRDPLGTPESLRALNPDRLTAFYKRWYRPENAVLVIVGDVDPNELIQRMSAALGSWHGEGPPPPHPPLGRFNPQRPPARLVLTESEFPNLLSVCAMAPPEPRGAPDIARLRALALLGIAESALGSRFDMLAQAPESGLIRAAVNSDLDNPELSKLCINAEPGPQQWKTAMAAIKAEVETFLKEGPTDEEMESAVKAERARLRGALPNFNARRSASEAEALVAAALEQRPMPSPFAAFAAFNLAVADVTAKDVREAFGARWLVGGPFIAAVAAQPPTPAELAEGWEKAAGAPIKIAASGPAWPYTDFGPAGRPVRRIAMHDPEFLRVIFDNGVVANIKYLPKAKGTVRLAVVLGRGRREIANKDLFTARFGAELLPLGGLGKIDASRIRAHFAEADTDLSINISDWSLSIDLPASPGGAEEALQWLAAEVSDPGFRTLDRVIAASRDSYYAGRSADPISAIDEAVANTFAPGSALALPARADYDRITAADIARVLKPVLTGDPLEVTVVGDLREDDAIALLATTFGALPKRGAPPTDRPDTFFMRFPDRELPTVTVHHTGSAEKAAVVAIWPLYVANAGRRREEYTLSLIADVLEQKLLRTLRDRFGATYSPVVETTMPDDSDQGELRVTIECTPDHAALAEQVIREIGAQTAAGAFTPEDLEAVRRPRLAHLAEEERTADWWREALAGSYWEPGVLEEARVTHGLFAAITLEETRQVAAHWLTRGPFVFVARPRSEGRP
jgi:zinc protease